MSVASCSFQLVRFLVIIFTVVFVLCGATLIGLGVWLFVDERVTNVVQLVDEAHNSHLLRDSAIVLISIGCLLFVSSLVGCLGAILKNTPLLSIYLILLIMAFCGEIVGAVLAIAFKDWLLDQLHQVLRRSLIEAPGYYQQDSTECKTTDIGTFWDYVQVEMDCCGIEASPKTGYESVTYAFEQYCSALNTTVTTFNRPLTCCIQDSSTEKATDFNHFHCPSVKTKGCLEKIQSWTGYYSPVLIGIGLGVAMLQMIGVIFIVCLCVNSRPHVQGYKRQH